MIWLLEKLISKIIDKESFRYVILDVDDANKYDRAIEKADQIYE